MAYMMLSLIAIDDTETAEHGVQALDAHELIKKKRITPNQDDTSDNNIELNINRETHLLIAQPKEFVTALPCSKPPELSNTGPRGGGRATRPRGEQPAPEAWDKATST